MNSLTDAKNVLKKHVDSIVEHFKQGDLFDWLRTGDVSQKVIPKTEVSSK